MGRFLRKELPLSVVLFLGITAICGQENAGSSVARSLRECYNTTEHLDRDSRPPATIGVLIDLIRKVENSRTPADARTLSLSLIHRFRQDGIVKAIEAEDVNVPYSPKGFQSNKNKILLKELIISDAMKFPNETLNSVEKCSMHFMLSNTVETNKRGDEGSVCGKLGSYMQRIRRRRDAPPARDKEQLSPNQRNPDDIEGTETEPEIPVHRPPIRPRTPGVYNDVPITERSKCPIESGVIWTRWGAVQAGSVLAGIATGISKQLINVHNIEVDNRYASTLTGDLVEAALYRRTKMQVGVSGNWNSTVAPRYYFINVQDKYEITDTELRGGLDGLIIALQMEDWRKAVQTLRISQILDMYYGPRGVLGTKYRACDRKTILTEAAPTQKMQEQALGFGRWFNEDVSFDVSPDEDEIKTYTDQAVNEMLSAITNLQDLNCNAVEENKRTATDLLIILDTAWKYEHISPALFNLLENLDVNIFGESRYKIINAMDGQVIMETSEYSVDLYQMYNRTIHDKHPAGFSARQSMSNARNWLEANVNNASATSHMNGRSQVILFVPFMGNLGSDDFNSDKEFMKSYLPDGKTLVLCNDNKDKYSPLVQSVGFDAFQLDATTDSSSILTAMKPVIARFRDLPRSLVNPKCKVNFENNGEGDSSTDFYIEPGTVSYYRVSPHYFYGEGERWLSVQGSAMGSLTVCGSRTSERPREKSGDADCKDINSDDHRWNLDGFCNDAIGDCQSFYISVESKNQTQPAKCTEAKCRFPDNIRYTVKMQHFQCRGGSIQNTAMMSLVILAVILRNLL